MALIQNIAPTTELEAVNAMLRAIGEAPVEDLAGGQADLDMALGILRDTTREVLTMGWRFNTEAGLAVVPAATVSWLDTDGVHTTLNVFKKPSGTVAWKPTVCPQMGDLDLVERLSKQYLETGAKVLVLYDRTRNRDGAEASRYPKVYLDVVWACDFEQMPETARKYTTMLSAGRLAKSSVGSETLVGFTQDDMLLALRALKRDQGETEDYNLFDGLAVNAILGGRPRPYSGASRRVYP